MTKITPEVLAAVAAARESFRARGRPLSRDAVEDLARVWLQGWREMEGTGEASAHLWAGLELDELHREEPESALAVLGHALDLQPGLDAEYYVFEELRTLLQAQAAFAQSRLPAFFEAHPSLRSRLTRLCQGQAVPPGWSDDVFAQLCALVAH
jgi:hypothetical protein